MHQFVQSAIEAAKRGEKNKAIEFLKQGLNTNPNDVEAWLVLSAVVDDPERKRQVFNRVLTLDPVNKIAREELIKLDRRAMGQFLAETDPPLPPKPQPAPAVSSTLSTSQLNKQPDPIPAKPSVSSQLQTTPPESQTSLRQQISPRPQEHPNTYIQKPLIFKYPIIRRVLTYIFVVIFGCGGLLIASQNSGVALPFLTLGLLFGLTALSFPPSVEVSETGIRTIKMLGGSEIRWNEIIQIKSNSIKQNLILLAANSKSVKISGKLKGYPIIVETLRQKRPDLFGMASISPAQSKMGASDYANSPSSQYGGSVTPPVFSGEKVFRKNFFRQYGMSFIGILSCLLFVWLTFVEPEYRTASIVTAGFCVLITIVPFFQVGTVRIRQDKLNVETFFEQKEFSARQIKEIKMQAIHGRYGRVTNLVNIIPIEGKNYPLGGFSDGEEIIYGVLVQWWESNRNR